jgi:antitoxin ParD1/3/4
MKAYRTSVTIDDPKQIVLRDLPFNAGQSVEIVIVPRGGVDGESSAKLRTLFRETQALPQSQALSEDDVIAEVAAHRAGR